MSIKQAIFSENLILRKCDVSSKNDFSHNSRTIFYCHSNESRGSLCAQVSLERSRYMNFFRL